MDWKFQSWRNLLRENGGAGGGGMELIKGGGLNLILLEK